MKTMVGKTKEEWLAHIEELFSIAHDGDDIPEAALLFAWPRHPTAEDFRWADEQINKQTKGR
jgi:hypothetical protein